jgi:hypothetical protein
MKLIRTVQPGEVLSGFALHYWVSLAFSLSFSL